MDNFNIDARQIKAAMTMQAKNDIRHYLNGLLIGGGKVVATDGHRMIVVDSPRSEFEPTVFSIRGVISKQAIDCEFVFIGDDHGVVMSKNGKGVELDSVVKFSIVDGRYPDYKKVMPNGDGEPVKRIGFNIGYVSDVNKASLALGNKMNHGEFKFYDGGNKASIRIETFENSATCIIMATRL